MKNEVCLICLITSRLGEGDCKERNQSFYECLTCIHEGKFSRKLDQLLLLSEDKVSSQPFNPVVAAFVDELTKHDSGQPGSSILRQEAVECLRGARHGKFVSEFHIGLQAIVYAIAFLAFSVFFFVQHAASSLSLSIYLSI